MIPSLIGLVFFGFIIMGKMGFRGRATVAGIDLGTTNSVVCVQKPSKTVGEIECIPDPVNNSPIIPSVISFLDHSDGNPKKKSSSSSKNQISLDPHPSHVIVGHEAKLRIDSHPHHTLYHAKRVLGRSYGDDAVNELREEVEFDIIPTEKEDENELNNDGVMFRVPHHHWTGATVGEGQHHSTLSILPQQVGSYIVNHLMNLTKNYLGHENVKSAVIAIPAKFNQKQRRVTIEAFKNAGVTVTRVLEEPTAAALAYGLDKKDGVNHIIVYDFGGGTLDISVLHVSDGGYVDVMGSDGDDRLGGADFDAAVAHALLEKDGGNEVVNRVSDVVKRIEKKRSEQQHDGDDEMDDDFEEMLVASCPVLEKTPLCTLSSYHTIGEKMKIGLSAYPDGGGVVKESCLGIPKGKQNDISTLGDFCSALELVQLSFSSSEYHSAVADLYKRSLIPVRRILADLNLQKDEIDEVVMVGGTTRMPQIRVMVQKELGVQSLNTHIDPDITVAYGAASVID